MCHVSVGHVARVLEERGLPTVGVYVQAFRHVVDEMVLPRAVITPHFMGRPLGPPGDAARQRAVLEVALDLLDSATTRTVVELPYAEKTQAGSSTTGRVSGQ